MNEHVDQQARTPPPHRMPGVEPGEADLGGAPHAPVRADTTNIYWIDGAPAGGVLECALGGCSQTPTTLAVAYNPGDIAVYASNVYWTSAQCIVTTDAGVIPPDGVATCPATGCTSAPTVLAKTAAGAVAVDSSGVYWYGLASVLQCPLSGCGADGGAAVTLATGIDNAGIRTDSQYVYVMANDNTSGTSKILRLAKP